MGISWLLLAFGAVLSRCREASENASRKSADEAAETSRIVPEGRQTSPEEAKLASWKPLRQVGARWPPRPLWKRSWAALEAVLAAPVPCQDAPGSAQEAPAKGSGSLCGASSDVSAPEAETRLKTCYLSDLGRFFGQGICFDFHHRFACVARARPSNQHRKIMNNHWFLWVASHSRVFAGTAQGKTF